MARKIINKENEDEQDFETQDDLELHNSEDTEDDDESIQLKDDRHPAYSLKREEIEDVFEDIGEPLLREVGDQVTYTIQRNGEVVGKERHPFTMKQLQEKYKGGVYRVVVRSTKYARIITSYNFTLADPIVSTQEKITKEMDASPMGRAVSQFLVHDPSAREQKKENSLPEILSAIFQVSEAAKREANEANARMMEIMAANQRAMIEMIGPTRSGSSSGSELKPVMESMEMMMKMMRQNAEFTTEMISSLAKQMKAQQESSSSKGDVINDPSKIFSLMMKTKQDALQEFRTIQELAKEHAKRMTRDDDDDEEKGNVLESALKTFAPIIQKAIAPQPVAQAMPQANPRGLLHQQPRGPMPGRSAPGGIANPQTGAQNQRGTAQRQTSIQGNQKMVINQTIKPIGVKPMGLTKEKAISLIGGKIAQALLTKRDAKETASDCLTSLQKAGHTEKEAINLFPTPESFTQVCHENGIPSLADSWLTEFYGAFRSVDTKGSG